MALKENYQQPVNKDMLTAVVVDSQMANCNGFGLSASNPTFFNHCKHLKKYSSCRPKKEKKKLSSGLAKSIPSQFKSVKTDTSMAWIKKSRSSLQQKAYWTRTGVSRSTLQELLKCVKVLVISWSRVYLPRAFLFHVVRKRAHWTRTVSRGQPLSQTMENGTRLFGLSSSMW